MPNDHIDIYCYIDITTDHLCCILYFADKLLFKYKTSRTEEKFGGKKWTLHTFTVCGRHIFVVPRKEDVFGKRYFQVRGN